MVESDGEGDSQSVEKSSGLQPWWKNCPAHQKRNSKALHQQLNPRRDCFHERKSHGNIGTSLQDAWCFLKAFFQRYLNKLVSYNPKSARKKTNGSRNPQTPLHLRARYFRDAMRIGWGSKKSQKAISFSFANRIFHPPDENSEHYTAPSQRATSSMERNYNSGGRGEECGRMCKNVEACGRINVYWDQSSTKAERREKIDKRNEGRVGWWGMVRNLIRHKDGWLGMQVILIDFENAICKSFSRPYIFMVNLNSPNPFHPHISRTPNPHSPPSPMHILRPRTCWGVHRHHRLGCWFTC